MARITQVATLAIAAFALSTSAFAQTSFMELEDHGGVNPDNNTKATAEVVVGMAAGDSICGISQGTSTTNGNVITSADTWDISTAAQATPGFYEWTLTIATSAGTVNNIGIRGLGSTGLGDCISPAAANTTDSTLQSDSSDVIRWYSNEQPSRLYVRVTGSATSAGYCATLACTPVVTPNLGTFAAGSIFITSRGQTHTNDTELAVYDSARNLIPGWRNDDACPTPGSHTLGSELTRTYTAGTYYVVISNWQTANSDPSPSDDNFGGGLLMDFSNAIVNNSSTTTTDVSFAIDDGSGPVAVAAAKAQTFDVKIFEFTVGAGNLVGFCNGDGGDQMGCTNCPCGNNALPGTIGGCLNSNGTSAQLIASGNPDVTTPADTLHFDLVGGTFPGSFGVLISGDNRLPNAGACPPGSGISSGTLDGLRCVGGAALRHGSRSLGTTGNTAAGWGPPANPTNGIGVSSGFIAGQTRHFQCFYREQATLGCMTGQNTSNAISVTFL